MLDSKNKKYFNNIYDNTYVMVLRFIGSRCHNRSDIEDIVQDVYLVFYQRIMKYGFSDIDCVEAFLISICKKKLSDYFAKLKAQSTSNFDEYIQMSNEITVRESFLKTEENVVEKMLLEKVWEEISTEGEVILEIFRLKFIKDLTFEQISTIIGLSESTVKTKYYRTLKKMKNKHNNKHNKEG